MLFRLDCFFAGHLAALDADSLRNLLNDLLICVFAFALRDHLIDHRVELLVNMRVLNTLIDEFLVLHILLQHHFSLLHRLSTFVSQVPRRVHRFQQTVCGLFLLLLLFDYPALHAWKVALLVLEHYLVARLE